MNKLGMIAVGPTVAGLCMGAALAFSANTSVPTGDCKTSGADKNACQYAVVAGSQVPSPSVSKGLRIKSGTKWALIYNSYGAEGVIGPVFVTNNDTNDFFIPQASFRELNAFISNVGKGSLQRVDLNPAIPAMSYAAPTLSSCAGLTLQTPSASPQNVIVPDMINGNTKPVVVKGLMNAHVDAFVPYTAGAQATIYPEYIYSAPNDVLIKEKQTLVFSPAQGMTSWSATPASDYTLYYKKATDADWTPIGKDCPGPTPDTCVYPTNAVYDTLTWYYTNKGSSNWSNDLCTGHKAQSFTTFVDMSGNTGYAWVCPGTGVTCTVCSFGCIHSY